MNPRVTAVTPGEGQALLLQFNNGEQRRMDVSPYLAYPVFERLREPGFFCAGSDRPRDRVLARRHRPRSRLGLSGKRAIGAGGIGVTLGSGAPTASTVARWRSKTPNP